MSCWTRRAGAGCAARLTSASSSKLDVALARERLRQRKQRGGYKSAWIEGHYARSDGPNTQRILQQRLPADVTLVWRQMDGHCGWQVVADAHTGEKTG